MCPTAISMNAYVLRIHILPYVVELCSESVLTRHPDTGLARYSARQNITNKAYSTPLSFFAENERQQRTPLTTRINHVNDYP
ncbi:Uncharacterised protein [Salmonella enterica subsp. enterica serovar Typhi]|nr:Uncharacterised protein [Salmonella enterica subsp. enterica serovar Typhi]